MNRQNNIIIDSIACLIWSALIKWNINVAKSIFTSPDTDLHISQRIVDYFKKSIKEETEFSKLI